MIETVLVFAAVPAVVVLIVVGLVYAGGARSGARRYRPGRPFEFAPVWFLSAPEQQPVAAEADAGRRSVSGANRLALSKGDEAAAGTAPAAVTGGASDRW
jgi:hypothetical protein